MSSMMSRFTRERRCLPTLLGLMTLRELAVVPVPVLAVAPVLV